MTNKMNVKLLRRVKAHILEEPKRLQMGTWIEDANTLPREKRPACGTVACIAGWAVLLSGVESSDYDRVSVKAAELLGIGHSNAMRLFFVGGWPRRFDDAYCKARTPQARAQVAADRIDHFVKTGE